MNLAAHPRHQHKVPQLQSFPEAKWELDQGLCNDLVLMTNAKQLQAADFLLEIFFFSRIPDLIPLCPACQRAGTKGEEAQ